MSIILPTDLSKFINKEIFIYKSFHITTAKLLKLRMIVSGMPVVGIFVDSIVGKKALNLTKAVLFSDLTEARCKQGSDIHRIILGKYMSRYEIPDRLDYYKLEYYESIASKVDMDYFLMSLTKNQINKEEYKNLIKLVVENHPEYLII